MPADVIGSLTGLTEGRFPVYARARYADDVAEQQLVKRVQRGENAANLVESDDKRRNIDIFAKQGAPVVAVNDGVIKKIDRNKKLGRYVVLQDVYGNRYTYAHLGEISKFYPVPKRDADASDTKRTASALSANSSDPAPDTAASAGRQSDSSDTKQGARPRRRRAQRRHAGLRAREGAPLRASGSPGRARGRRPRAGARRAGAQERQVRDLQELLLAPVRRRSRRRSACAR